MIWTRLKLWRCAKVGASPRVLGRVWIHGEGNVHLGDGVTIDGRSVPVELNTHPGGLIVLGDGVRLEGGASIEAQGTIVVGARSTLGPLSKVIDTHYHSVRGDRKKRPPTVPVRIDEDVEVGARAILLPGALLERGVKVPPGAVVSRRVKARAP